MIACIYQIENSVNGRRYIGSTVNWHRRSAGHRCDLRNNRHGNSHLQRAWLKYGEHAFVFSILERIDDVAIMPAREQAHLDAAGENIYNVGKWTDAPWRGEHFSQAHKRNLSVAWESRKVDRKIGVSTRQRAFKRTLRAINVGRCFKGHERTPEHTTYRFDKKRQKTYPVCLLCRKDRNAKRNAQYLAEHGPNPQRGVSWSAERKALFGARRALKPWSRKGTKHSEETRAKLRKAWILRKSRQQEVA